MFEIGKNYSVNYKTEEGRWISLYVHMKNADSKKVTFTISAVFNDTEHESLEAIMNADLEIEWTNEEFARTEPFAITKKELTYNGRCPKCALMGEMRLRALWCRRHGAFGGC